MYSQYWAHSILMLMYDYSEWRCLADRPFLLCSVVFFSFCVCFVSTCIFLLNIFDARLSKVE